MRVCTGAGVWGERSASTARLSEASYWQHESGPLYAKFIGHGQRRATDVPRFTRLLSDLRRSWTCWEFIVAGKDQTKKGTKNVWVGVQNSVFTSQSSPVTDLKSVFYQQRLFLRGQSSLAMVCVVGGGQEINSLTKFGKDGRV